MPDQQPDGTEAFEGGYRLIRPDQPLSREFRDAYWERVREIVRKVFRGDERRIDDAQKRLDELEKQQPQTIFYHADPFEVAADLAGRRGQPITPEEKARYQQEVLRSEDRPPPDHLKAVHPED